MRLINDKKKDDKSTFKKNKKISEKKSSSIYQIKNSKIRLGKAKYR